MPRELFVAYFRVGTDRLGRLHPGLGAQHMAIADYLNGGDRELVGTYTETESVRRGDRPQLARALEACRRLNATLIIASLDGLAHDAQTMSSIFDGIADGGVVFCDLLHSPTAGEGKNRAQQMAAMTAPEAGLISQRERPGWAAVEACAESGGWADAAQQEHDGTAGRAYTVHRRLADQRAADISPVIREVQASGVRTLQGIADALNARGVRTARGGRWYPTTVRNLLRRDV
jgi:DNA invertase Pin-like site-specific DNA recombinase